MGMFDEVLCEMELPNPPPVDERRYQTKSLDDPSLRQLVITADGRLRNDDDNKYIDFHGVFTFCTYISKGIETLGEFDKKRWYEYKTKFTDGKCVEIKRVYDND